MTRRSLAILSAAVALLLTAVFVAAPADAFPDGNKSKAPSKKKKRNDKVEVPVQTRERDMVMASITGVFGERFKVKETDAYVIFYDTSDEDVEVFALAITKTFNSCEKFMRQMGVPSHPPRYKLVSHFFNDFQDYSTYSAVLGRGALSPNLLGYYLPTNNHSYFYNYRNTPYFKALRENAERAMKQLGEQMRNPQISGSQRRAIQAQIKQQRFIINRTKSFGGGVTEATLQHECAHQILWNIGFHNPQYFFCNPRWFAEGMASLFEPISDGRASNMGAINDTRHEQFQYLARAEYLIPLRYFVASMWPFLRGDAGGLAYPEAWALCHYLTRTRRVELQTYIKLLNERPKSFVTTPEAEIATWEKAFGPLDEKWEKRWLDWMKDLH